jgi:hypothetical protein
VGGTCPWEEDAVFTSILRKTVFLRKVNNQLPDCTVYIVFYCRVDLEENYYCNSPWRPVGLWEVEAPICYRQMAVRLSALCARGSVVGWGTTSRMVAGFDSRRGHWNPYSRIVALDRMSTGIFLGVRVCPFCITTQSAGLGTILATNKGKSTAVELFHPALPYSPHNISRRLNSFGYRSGQENRRIHGRSAKGCSLIPPPPPEI